MRGSYACLRACGEWGRRKDATATCNSRQHEQKAASVERLQREVMLA